MEKKATYSRRKILKKPKYTWNLKLFYNSPTDSRIEKDIQKIESACTRFARKYDVHEKAYLKDSRKLLSTLRDYEKWIITPDDKPFIYFKSMIDIDTRNKEAAATLALIQNRISKATNEIRFFRISLGSIDKARQKSFLQDRKLSRYRFFLQRIFENAEHTLSVPEEKILSLKQQPAHAMWVSANERMLNERSIIWKGKKMPLSETASLLMRLKKQRDRHSLRDLVIAQLKTVSPLAEAELNAIITNKKISDDLRGYALPHQSTVRSYGNDPKVVETLIDSVTKTFPMSHRYFKIRKKCLGLKTMEYCDRSASPRQSIKKKFPFKKSIDILGEIFGKINVRYSDIIQSYFKRGQIDATPRMGKRGGGFCRSTYALPTLIFLNDTGNLSSFGTLAHEMGHAIHGELSRSQGPLYCGYSTSLAETASTLFESIALEAVFETLPAKDKALVLLDRIGNSVKTIFCQVACFNFEKELHQTIRTKGFVSADEIADIHNKHMSAYVGPAVKMKHDDGYAFVSWIHLRLFFYVYSYAYGMLVSKALLRRYKKDKSFWAKIEQFLSAGGKDSPENILKEIGIDVLKPSFWKEGLQEIEDDITRLEKLIKK